jgi:fumarate reductase flavoprotein subunit
MIRPCAIAGGSKSIQNRPIMEIGAFGMPILPADTLDTDAHIPALIIGAGACGQVAALTLHDAGQPVLLVERDPVPQGSTALSSGMIPACGTRLQEEQGVIDPVEQMRGDLIAKAKGESDPAIVQRVCEVSGATIDWLIGEKGIPLELVNSFTYPGHSVHRMHAPPSRTGAELMGALTNRCAQDGIDILTDAIVTDLFATAAGAIAGVRIARPDGGGEDIGCDALILACNGFGGNLDLVRQYIPEIADAVYCGHVGNQGDAIRWGEALGAATADLGSFQGHGSVAHQHNILISWALMMEGGFQVNRDGRRFSNEHGGYSEQGKIVASQPGALAWDIYDARCHELGLEFEDYRDAVEAGAVVQADTIEELATGLGLPVDALAETVTGVAGLAEGLGQDPFGRDFTKSPALAAPFFGIKVCGALFHTQGGLEIDTSARVLREDGSRLPNLFAGGGAARGLSGKADYGYLSGNGLLAAVMLGRIAGQSAAKLLTP